MSSACGEHPFKEGDRVYHQKRYECGTYQYRDPAEPETAMVAFDGGDEARVTVALLVPETERPQ